MARKSKSSKNSDKTKASDDTSTVEVVDAELVADGESTGDADGVIIEAEAVDVTQSEDVSPETDAQIEGESNDETGPDQTTSESDPAEDVSVEAQGESAPGDVDEQPDAEILEQTTTEPTPVPPPAAAPARSSPVPLIFGGLVAGGLGYFAATMTPADVPETSGLSEGIATNVAQLEALSTDVEALKGVEAPEVDLSGIEGTISELAGRIDELDQGIADARAEVTAATTTFEEKSNALSDRLTVLETAGPGESEEADRTAEQLAAFRAELERMTAEAETRVATSMERASEIESAALAATAEAEEAAAEAERQAAEAAALAEKEAAIAALKTALEAGTGFADEVAVIGDVPEVLSANAADGVPTLIDLQQTFSDNARQALGSAEELPQDASAGQRLTAFLKQRTNARSLTPKEGNSADAILSRAESMVKQGDLGAALVELDALGDAPKAVIQPWLDKAATRQSALDAAEQLSATN